MKPWVKSALIGVFVGTSSNWISTLFGFPNFSPPWWGMLAVVIFFYEVGYLSYPFITEE